MDRAFRLDHELPPVILYKLDGAHFVKDAHHGVSAARFHGAEWIDAEVAEFRPPDDQPTFSPDEDHTDATTPSPAL